MRAAGSAGVGTGVAVGVGVDVGVGDGSWVGVTVGVRVEASVEVGVTVFEGSDGVAGCGSPSHAAAATIRNTNSTPKTPSFCTPNLCTKVKPSRGLIFELTTRSVVSRRSEQHTYGFVLADLEFHTPVVLHTPQSVVIPYSLGHAGLPFVYIEPRRVIEP